MKTTIASIMMISTIFGIRDVGDGGSDIHSKYIVMQRDVLKFLRTDRGKQHLTRHQLSYSTLAGTVSAHRVKVVDDPLYDVYGNSVDALTTREAGTTLYKEVWQDHLDHCRQVHHLVYKEMLRGTGQYNALASNLISNELINDLDQFNSLRCRYLTKKSIPSNRNYYLQEYVSNGPKSWQQLFAPQLSDPSLCLSITKYKYLYFKWDPTSLTRMLNWHLSGNSEWVELKNDQCSYGAQSMVGFCHFSHEKEQNTIELYFCATE